VSVLNLTVELVSALHSNFHLGGVIPDPGPSAPPGVSAGVTNLIAFAKYGGYILGAIALVLFGGTLWWSSRQGQGGQVHVTGLGLILLGVVLVGAAVGIVSSFIPA
jgi:hypothetical protein